jgi:glycosyltransferase involved in cell wall biosynthesis
MKVLIGAAANNAHLHQVGQAMDEAGALSRYILPFGGFPLRHPVVFARRSPAGIPKSKLRQHPAWDIARLAASKLGLPDPWVDLIWEQGELSFDRACARSIGSERPDVYMGVEHAALASLQASSRFGAAAGLIFPSLHHAFRKKWLDPELARYPQLLGPSARIIRGRDAARDSRRDEEMRAAEFIHANSATTARSLVEAGYPADRIITVPLGSPKAADDSELPAGPPAVPTVMFAGNVALHKGAHHLIEAWRSVAGSRRAKLDLYGGWALPEGFRPLPGENITAHGRVPHEMVREAMRRASVLVLPSVCDGFGMVVTEAMAQGIPVICSANAGASQLVVEGVNGFVVPAADPDQLGKRLIWCIEHPRELHAMGRSAVDTARHWTWADFRAQLVRDLGAMLAHIGASKTRSPAMTR